MKVLTRNGLRKLIKEEFDAMGGETYDCDGCGKSVPLDDVQQVNSSFGETTQCSACRGVDASSSGQDICGYCGAVDASVRDPWSGWISCLECDGV